MYSKKQVVAVLVVVALSVVAYAGELSSAPLSEHVPADAVLYAGWSGQTRSWEATRLSKLLAEFNFAGYLRRQADLKLEPARKRQAAATQPQEGTGQTNSGLVVPWAEPDIQPILRGDMQSALILNLLALTWHKPMAFAVTGMTAPPASDQTEDVVAKEPLVDWQWLIDIGPEHKAFDTQLKDLLKLADVLEPRQTERGWQMTLADGRPLHIGYVSEGILCLTTQADALAKLSQLPAEESLAKSKRFVQHMSKVRGPDAAGELAVLFVDYPRLSEQAVKAAPDEAAGRELKAQYSQQGRDALDVVAASISLADGGNLYTKALFFLRAKPAGMWTLFNQPAIEDADLSPLRKDTYLFSAWKGSGTTIVQQMNAAKDSESLLNHFSSAMREDVGVGLDDWVPALGGTWVISASPSQGGLVPGLMLSASVLNQPMLDAAQEKLKQHIAKPFEAPEGRGFLSNRSVTPYYLHTRHIGQASTSYLLRKKEIVKFAVPAWTVHKGRFYLAAYPQAIAAALEQGQHDSLIADSGFVSLRKKVSSKACMLGYLDTARVCRDYYGWAVVICGVEANAEASGGNWVLPTSSRLSELLGRQISAVSMADNIVMFEEYGPLPLIGLGSLGWPLDSLLAAPTSALIKLPY